MKNNMPNGFKKVMVGHLTTVGEELIRARAAHNLTREAVAEELAIPLRYVEALETGNYTSLPGTMYIRGWLKKYATALQLPLPDIMQRYHREAALYDTPAPKTTTGKRLIVSRLLSVLTLRRLSVTLILLLALGYIGFILYQGLRAPTVTLAESFVDRQTQQDSIMVEGTTDVGAELMINNQTVELDDHGAFQEEVALIDGINTITVEAKRPHSRLFTKTMTVVKTQAPSLQ